ncbi:GntR family transcriptional regulator [Pseudoclavibacter sp. VKM Ac-2867]|uniref:GntR family transcriptional regulator n=1 Tax=Pseudoclavibacter sp. VKM Ac-2867 TaxID=2783829 RepID=UPI00188B592A|nr:GntR family transcriptional regulator [Pseudoclavibacter sp. VKM Ac-2867]MBF4459398.1 GntR family transcriptional regulator [Pseudoclavibacter sp. VKM Ac-2867]
MTTPKYQKLADALRERIFASPVGAAIESERQLADEAGISRMTARRAIDELVREGLLVREVGRGTFVARPVVSVPLQLTSFSEDMRARGHLPTSRVLQATHLEATEELAAVFCVSPGEDLLLLSRLRLADGVPLAIERTHLRARDTPALLERDFAEASLYQVLADEYGIRFEAGRQIIRAGIVLAEDATLLQIDPGSPVLELLRTTISDGSVIEWTISTYPASRFELSAQIAPATAPADGALSALSVRPNRPTG